MLNVLLTDYHNINPKIMNNYNVTNETFSKIDWKDFESVLDKTYDEYISNLVLHIYDGVLLTKKTLDMLNAHNVTVHLPLNDTMSDEFFNTYFIKYCIMDRFSVTVNVTDMLDADNWTYIERKMWNSYSMFHLYPLGVKFNFMKNFSSKVIQYFITRMNVLLDNRTGLIPTDLFFYALNDMVKEANGNQYVPYSIFIEKDGIVTINDNVIRTEETISIPIEKAHVHTAQFNAILNKIYGNIIETYGCNNCAGRDICPKMMTIFNEVAPENCSRDYKEIWTPFVKLVNDYNKVMRSFAKKEYSNDIL